MSRRRPQTFDTAIMALSYFDEDPEIKAAMKVLIEAGKVAPIIVGVSDEYGVSFKMEKGVAAATRGLAKAILAARKVSEGGEK
jgi:hypothetical protein